MYYNYIHATCEMSYRYDSQCRDFSAILKAIQIQFTLHAVWNSVSGPEIMYILNVAPPSSFNESHYMYTPSCKCRMHALPTVWTPPGL